MIPYDSVILEMVAMSAAFSSDSLDWIMACRLKTS